MKQNRFDSAPGQMIGVRFPADAVTAIDAARMVGLFQRTRSEFIRDAVLAYVKSDSAMAAAVRRAIDRNAL